MTELVIEVSWNGITAMEIYCGDDIKYIETFPTWHNLLDILQKYMQEYSWVSIRRILPTDTKAYPILG